MRNSNVSAPFNFAPFNSCYCLLVSSIIIEISNNFEEAVKDISFIFQLFLSFLFF